MKLRNSWRMFVIVLAGGVAACSSVGERMWIPQQPGDAGSPAPVRAHSLQPALAPVAPAEASHAAAAPNTYVQARRYGDLLFLSGQIATDPQSNELPADLTVGQQTDIAMRKIAAILVSHRLTLANVVQATVYLSAINDLSEMNVAYEAHFRGELPARTVVEVVRLPRGARVQIDVVAGR